MREEGTRSPGRTWIRAAGLFLIAYLVPVAEAPVLIAVLFLELAFVLGVRKPAVLLTVALALLVVLPWSPWDGMSYLERAWALLVGAWFAGITVWRPAERFMTRALGAVAGAAAAVGAFVAVRPNAWGIVEQAVIDRMSAGVSATFDVLRGMGGGQTVPKEFITMLDGMMHFFQVVFPAMLALASLAALGVAWWLYGRLARDDDQAVGPLRDFRFNDHLVWVFVGGLVLLVAQWGGVLGRVGSNAVVFMGALYALRGVAVILFMSGGLSLGWAFLLILGIWLVFPVLLAGLAIIGLGDTWLDIRSRTSAA